MGFCSHQSQFLACASDNSVISNLLHHCSKYQPFRQSVETIMVPLTRLQCHGCVARNSESKNNPAPTALVGGDAKPSKCPGEFLHCPWDQPTRPVRRHEAFHGFHPPCCPPPAHHKPMPPDRRYQNPHTNPPSQMHRPADNDQLSHLPECGPQKPHDLEPHTRRPLVPTARGLFHHLPGDT